MGSAKESLREKVEELSEEEARRVLDLLGTGEVDFARPRKTELTREVVAERLRGRPGFGLPEENAPAFEKFEPIETTGIPASKLLIADRR